VQNFLEGGQDPPGYATALLVYFKIIIKIVALRKLCDLNRRFRMLHDLNRRFKEDS